MSKIALVLAVYNGEKFISALLESIFSNNLDNVTIIVVDDHSTDKTIEIISSFKNSFDLKIVKSESLSRDPILRIRDNFVLGLQRCNADYYFFCDQDDIWSSRKIEEYVENLEIANIVYSGYQLFGEQSGKIDVKDFSSMHLINLLASNVCPGMCVAFDKVAKYHLLRNFLNLYNHDHGLFLLAYKYNLNVRKIPGHSLNYYRQHSDNVIGSKVSKKLHKAVHIIPKIIKNFLIYKAL